MQLTHSFRVPAGIDDAWAILRDIERIAPCMPGATIDAVEGDHFTGGVKVKVGPITVTYKGEADFVDVDDQHHRASIEARGKETRGSGTARATVHAELREVDGATEVTLVTDLNVTGKPAQFGRGVMADVGGKLIGQFADCLASELATPPAATETLVAAGTPAPAGTSSTGVDPAAEAGVRGGAGTAPSAEGGTTVPLATPPLGADGTVEVRTADLTGPAEPAATTPTPEGVPGTGEVRAADLTGPAEPAATTPPGVPGTGEVRTADLPGPAEPAATTPTPETAPGVPGWAGDGPRRRPTDDAIDLLDVAGAPILRRVAPIAAAVAVLLFLVSLLRRRSRRRAARRAVRGEAVRWGVPTLAVVTLEPADDH